jgi:hypothetical protein
MGSCVVTSAEQIEGAGESDQSPREMNNGQYQGNRTTAISKGLQGT